MRAFAVTCLTLSLLTACSREQDAAKPSAGPAQRGPSVTISADQSVSPVPGWRAPVVTVTEDNADELQQQAELALAEGRLFDDAQSALPLYLALRKAAPAPAIERGLEASLQALLAQGRTALDDLDTDPAQLRRAHQVAAVARVVDAGDERVVKYLEELDRVDQAQQFNRLGERELDAERLGESGKEGAIARFRQALEIRPGDARALQGLAAAESALIRRAEAAAARDNFDGAEVWLKLAERVRPGMSTVADARARLARLRALRIGQLRDQGIAALTRPNGVDRARGHLAALLRIARHGDPAAADLRERIDLAVHYGLFRPGQMFTDALEGTGRGPVMVVIPHGAFRMGAAPGEPGSADAERPARNIRFPRGLAVSRTEVTVGDFARFVAATGYRPRSVKRNFSTVYDERSGNLVRRGGVDWRADYVGRPASADMPVVHISAHDADAYAEWLSRRSGQRYRLPSEAEFEYALRAGSHSRYPWGNGAPPPRAGNFTGALDRSPGGRKWRNAFENYGDAAWGPAPVGSYSASPFRLHDLAGNVSEWVADCWHESYRRAPPDAKAWVNPGCRMRVVRGGSWASSPQQTRSAWRSGSDAETTNARIGFRVVREL